MIMREIATKRGAVTLDSRPGARPLQAFICGALNGPSLGLLWSAARRSARVAAFVDRTRAPPAVGRLTCHIS